MSQFSAHLVCVLFEQKAVERGANAIKEPTEMKDDHGSVVIATIQTVRHPSHWPQYSHMLMFGCWSVQYGNVWHSFVERKNYTGVFLPGYVVKMEKDPLSTLV